MTSQPKEAFPCILVPNFDGLWGEGEKKEKEKEREGERKGEGEGEREG